MRSVGLAKRDSRIGVKECQSARIVGRDGPKEGRQGMASKAVSKDGEQGQIARIVGRDGPKEGRQGMASKAVSKDGWQRRLASSMSRLKPMPSTRRPNRRKQHR